MSENSELLGYGLSLGCAAIWSASLIMYKSLGYLPAVRLNLFKNAVGFIAMWLTLWAVSGSLVPAASFSPEVRQHLWWLIASGVIGIGLADALVLWGLKVLPASYVAVFESLYPLFMVALAWWLFDETLSAPQYLGGLAILSGVLLVGVGGWGRLPVGLPPGVLVKGGLAMALAMLMMASGVLMVKPVFEHLPVWEIFTVRMFAGVMASWLLVGLTPRGTPLLNYVDSWGRRGRLLLASLMSTYIALAMWLLAYKYIEAGVAALLNQTSTIFTVLFALWFLGERLDRRRSIAFLLALCGVMTLAWA